MAGVTDIQRAHLARAAGFPENQIAMAVAVSIAENQAGDPTAQNHNTNGSVDTGLWQINSIHGIPVSQLMNPQANANAAFKVWTDAGRSWRPWSTYPAKAMVFFQRGQLAARDRTVPNPGGGPTISVDPNSSLGSITAALKFVSDPNNWRRLAYFIAGLVLVVVAIFKLTGNNQLSPVTKSLGKTAIRAAA